MTIKVLATLENILPVYKQMNAGLLKKLLTNYHFTNPLYVTKWLSGMLSV